MGANQSGGGGGGAPVGTNFKAIQKDRKMYGGNELPDIPLNKLREVCAEVDMTVKQSKYITAYKKEVRDALKRKKAKGQEPKLMRLYSKSLHPADDAVGKDEDRKAMIKLLVENISPVVKDDIIEGFKEDKKEGTEKSFNKQADDIVFKLIHERVHDLLQETADSIYKKYLKGADYNVSDDETEDTSALEEAKAERAREAAKQREHEAEVWLAEINGEEPPPKPDDDEEEEEEEEDDEE